MKITVTRAITEEKSLRERYRKGLNELTAVDVKRGSKLSGNPGIKPEDFEKQEKEKFQSLISLFNRAEELKNAINISNSTTKVTISGKEMTVQEAIVHKNNFLFLREEMLRILKMKKTVADRAFENCNNQNETLIDKRAAEIISSAGGDKTTAMQRAKEDVEKTYSVELVDPLGISAYIAKLEKEIEDFKVNVDFALSDINTATLIEVSD